MRSTGNSGAKRTATYAKVFRADGTQRGNALVAYSAKNPVEHAIVNWWLRLRDRLGLRGF